MKKKFILIMAIALLTSVLLPCVYAENENEVAVDEGHSQENYGISLLTAVDSEAPQLVDFFLDKSELSVGDVLTITATITDESGVSGSPTLYYYRGDSIGGNAQFLYTTLQNISGDVYQGTITITENTVSGKYGAASLRVKDIYGNEQSVFIWDKDFFVIGGTSDENAPELIDFSLDKTELDTGDVLTITATVTDESGVNAPLALYYYRGDSIGGNAKFLYTTLQHVSGDTYQGTITITENTVSGIYGAASLRLRDIYGNEKSAYIWDKKFHVIGGTSDVSAPELVDFSIDKDELGSGETLTITATVTDESGVDAPLALYYYRGDSIGGNAQFLYTTLQHISGDTYQGTITIRGGTVVGKYGAASLHLRDIYGNEQSAFIWDKDFRVLCDAAMHDFKDGFCTSCGVDDPNHIHTYQNVVVQPTCTEVGYTTFTCSCGYSYIGDEIPATGHTDSDVNDYCEQCGKFIGSGPIPALAIEISVDKTDITLGDTVTVSYNITGGNGDYTQLYFSIGKKVSASDSWIGLGLSGDYSLPCGSFTYTPNFTGQLDFTAKVRDSDRRYLEMTSPVVTIHSDEEAEPISIQISIDKTEIEVGETVTATYSFSGGSGKYDNVWVEWWELVTGNTSWHEVKSVVNKATDTSGTVSHTATIGGKLRFRVTIWDSEDRYAKKESGIVTIVDDTEFEPLRIEISLDKSEIEVEETVTASYSITGGNGEFKVIQWEWSQLVTGNTSWHAIQWENTWSDPSIKPVGAYSCTPVITGPLEFWVLAEDTDGRRAELRSEYVAVVCPSSTGHSEIKDIGIEPTCTKDGLSVGSHCSVCGKVIIKQERVPARGHSEIIDAAVAPTDTTTGLTEGKHCSVCNEVLVPQKKIPSLNYQQNPIPITGEIKIVTDDVAIGKPVTVQYSLSGGSGVFENVSLQALFHRGSGLTVGGDGNYQAESQGEWTFIPTEGTSLSVQIYGNDTYGQYFYIDGAPVPVSQNPDHIVTLPLSQDSVNIQEKLSAKYSIANCSSFSGFSYVTVATTDEYGWKQYSNNINRTPVSAPTGIIEFTPKFGDEFYYIIEGTTETGDRVYFESDPIRIIGDDNSEPIRATFSTSTENPQIGRELTISYKLEGGSGSYPNITMQALCPYSSGMIWGGFNKDFYATSGTWKLIPTEGAEISFQIYGRDSDGRDFYLNGPTLTLSPNPDKVVNIDIPRSASIGEKCCVHYAIKNCNSFTGQAYVTVKTKDPEYGWYDYSNRIYPNSLSAASGDFEFTPMFGDELYITIEGTTDDGDVVYIETKPVSISNGLVDDTIDLSGYNTLSLPSSMISIDEEAFSGIAAEVVIIPSNCNNIGYRAFADCKSLKYVVISPDANITIDDAAFEGTNTEILYQ